MHWGESGLHHLHQHILHYCIPTVVKGVSKNMFLFHFTLLSISLPLKTATGTEASNIQRGSTGWTGLRKNTMYVSIYSVFWSVLTCCFFSKVMAVHILSFCDVETPHCSNQNGAEGPLLVHPTANVLDTIWPKGTLKILYLLKGSIIVGSGNFSQFFHLS